MSSRHRSYWLQEVAGDAPDATPLRARAKADIAIVGGGYVGLWTAIRIKQSEPQCDVVILEQDICGGGASGRNGGFVLSWWPKLASLSKMFGTEEAIRVARRSEEAIAEIGEFCAAHAIDADYRQGGWLWAATSEAQRGAWDGLLDLCSRNGVDPFRRLDPAEVARRSGSTAHREGVFEGTAAIVQPARLARGLRRVALEMGVRIFERTKMQTFSRGRPVTIECDTGALLADTLVIATNAWAARIPELSRAIVVVSSEMVVTAPIPEELERIGWEPDLGITDSQLMVDYYRTTRDGRIAFGKGGSTLAFGGNIGGAFDRNPCRARQVTEDFRRYYPSLDHVPVTHDWSGPIDRTPNSVPLMGHLGGLEHIVYGVGWSGNGVGPSVIGGKVLAALALRAQNEWADHPLVDRPATRFPPEPIRFLGGHIVRAAVERKERAEIRDRAPSWLSVKLASLAPAGIEDKE